MDSSISEPLEKYQYERLGLGEIRIVRLLPGKPEDDIRVELMRAALEESEHHPHRLRITELSKTLPPGWSVYENLEGRYLFVRDGEDCAVYQATLLAHMKIVQRWEIFSSGWGGQVPFSAPSWVPDLASPIGTGRIPSRQFPAGHSALDFAYHASNVLEVTGRQCATVLEVGSGVPAQGTPEALLQVIQSWVPEDLKTATYPTGESLMDAFAITLRQNNLIHRFQRKAEPTLEKWRTYIQDTVLVSKPSDFDSSTFFATELARSCYGR